MTEVEVKLTISEEDYLKTIEHFKSFHKDTLDQWNIFFETADKKLYQNRCHLRLRRILSEISPERWVFTLKSPSQFSDGVCIQGEIEFDVEKRVVSEILKDPSQLYKNLPEELQKDLEFASTSQFQIKGDFRSVRRVILWEGLKIEADESFLPDGTKFHELEVESEKPFEAKAQLQRELDTIAVQYTDSNIGKLGRLMCLPPEKRFSRKIYSID